MIKTLKDYRDYLKRDFKGDIPSIWWLWLKCNDNYYPYKVTKLLRQCEYWTNRKRNIFTFIPYIISVIQLRRVRIKSGIMVFPNTIGPGLELVHPGFRRLDRFTHAGENLTVLPNVLFGKKRPNNENSDIVIGNNCYIGTGVTILGPVTIGDNVTIGAGAVVVSDIPSNSVVGGVPAKNIK